jgi:hypothetical protein
MIYLEFEDFINERLGINNDVLILSYFLYNILKYKNKKNFEIIKDIPKVSFIISKIIINFNSGNIEAFFNERYSKLTTDGVIISLSFNKNVDVKKSIINHELSHLIDYEKKISLKITKFKDNISASKISNIFNQKQFDNLCNLLYLSDDGEIRSFTHQIYEMINDIMIDMIKNEYDKNFIFKQVLIESGVKDLYTKMINYDIYDDLKNISDKSKLNFFDKFINLNKKMYTIKKNPHIHKLLIFFYYFFTKENDLNLDYIMKKTQSYINDKGIKLRNNIHRLYDLW